MLQKIKNYQLRILYSQELFSKSLGEIKTFSDEQKVRKFITCTPAFQSMLKEILQTEGKLYRSVIWIHMKKGRVPERNTYLARNYFTFLILN